MSSTFALVKFKTTGNVYFGCYDGTSDILIPHILTPEECYDEELDCYCSIIECRKLAQYKSWMFPFDELVDDVEIYSDYGGGFYWSGTGSETIRMVREPLNMSTYYETKDGMPEWAREFLESLEKKEKKK